MNRNGLRRKAFIRKGWKLKIPTSRRSASRRTSPRTYETRTNGDLLEYTVRRGDSLWEIANSFGTTTKAIQTLNHLKTNRLQVGQRLLLPKTKKSDDPKRTAQYQV